MRNRCSFSTNTTSQKGKRSGCGRRKGEKKEGGKKERKLAGVEEDEHKASALSAWLSPLSPSLLLSTPSPSCACLSNLQPPLFLVVVGFCSMHTSHSTRAKQKQSGCHLFCACICTCTCAQPKQHPSSVFVVGGAFHCRFARLWRYMPMDFCTTLKSARTHCHAFVLELLVRVYNK